MKVGPAISIIVPVYNIEAFISKCLDSILAQTFTDFEVIVVNDGSTDGSGKICDAYAEKDGRFRVVHQANGGVSSARNIGIDLAKGAYIGFVDGDDYIDKDMYGTLYRLCKENACDISICKLGREINHELVNPVKEPFLKEMDNREAMRQLFLGVLYRFSLCNKLYHEKCFKGILFPEGRIHEDLSTTYRIFSNADKLMYTDYIGYIYVKQKNSILTSRYHEKRLDALLGWDEILPFMEQHYSQLHCEVNACFTYAFVDHINYILKQVTDKGEKERYLKSIQRYVKKYYSQIRKNKILSLYHRLTATLLNYNVTLLIVISSLRGVGRKQ